MSGWGWEQQCEWLDDEGCYVAYLAGDSGLVARGRSAGEANEALDAIVNKLDRKAVLAALTERGDVVNPDELEISFEAAKRREWEQDEWRYGGGAPPTLLIATSTRGAPGSRWLCYGPHFLE